MGFISRFTTYFKTLFNQELDDVVNPSLDLDYWYQQQLEELQNLRRTIAEAITIQKRLEIQQSQIQTMMAKCEKQAQEAVSTNREDLACLAIERQQNLQSQFITFQQEIDKLEEQIEKFVQLERRHSAYTETFRTRKELIKARVNMTQTQIKIGKIAAGFSEKIDDFNTEAVRAHKIVLIMKARTNAMNQMIEQGTLSEVGDLPSADYFFGLQLNQAPSQANIDAKLAEIKQAMPHEPGTQSQSERSG